MNFRRKYTGRSNSIAVTQMERWRPDFATESFLRRDVFLGRAEAASTSGTRRYKQGFRGDRERG
jgi:hypothetical protein